MLYSIPEYALSYLINDDPSGLTDEEIKKIDAFIAREGILQVCYPEDDAYFAGISDFDGMGCNVADCECIMRPS